MTASAVAKSRSQNLLEGMTLTAVLQALPGYAGAVLLLRLLGGQAIVNHPGAAALFVMLACLCFALIVRYFGPKFPKLFKYSYEPLFFDPTLSFTEKLSDWRASPATSHRLVRVVLTLSVLAVAVVSVT